MNHVRNGAHKVYRIEHNDGLRAVWHTYCNSVAHTNSYGLERAGTDFHVLRELFIGGLFAHENIGGVVRVFFYDFFDGFPHAAFLILQVKGNIAVVFKPRCFCFGHYVPPQKSTGS